ncbi:hypothetical protein WISP_32779 [Willisornis vidua]|uniref:Uncharacterized protein n=1 Tax=Willisornis vidua TaxID=1566151 RepID=A0ABQ9DQ25_9PASS|nr:hypothetical protein WISP_32779 [Willisornis vidua]
MFVMVRYGGREIYKPDTIMEENHARRAELITEREARGKANCQVMLNLQCCVLILTTHLKRKCQCRPEDCIDLLDEMGTLMNLSKVENPAAEFTSKYLREREHYILIRVIREENSEATCYESLLEDLEKHYPDLTGKSQTPREEPGLQAWFLFTSQPF